MPEKTDFQRRKDELVRQMRRTAANLASARDEELAPEERKMNAAHAALLEEGLRLLSRADTDLEISIAAQTITRASEEMKKYLVRLLPNKR
jgi:hypothetical protein